MYSSFSIRGRPSWSFPKRIQSLHSAVYGQAGNTFSSRPILHPPSKPPNHASSIRFASTAPIQASDLASASVAEPVATAFDTPFGNASDIIASVNQPQIEPHIGFLKELGLDFGWGPTAFMEWSLEHVHVFLATPWWATLGITALAIRVVLFRTFVGAADNSARLAVIQPHLQDIQARIQKARQAQDTNAVMQASQEIRNVYAAAGVKIWRSFLPFIQVPLGYGMFRLTRSMAYLPVPGLEDGGALWFRDLTVSDPLFLLPVTTGVLTFYLFKLGGEAGAAANIPPLMFKGLQWVLPILSVAFMSFWPAAMQLGFTWTAILSLTQSLAFKQPWFRNFLGIHPLPPPASARPHTQTKGMVIPTTARTQAQDSDTPTRGLVGSATSKFKNFVEKNQKTPAGGRSKRQIAEAQRYEQKRRKEIQSQKTQAEQDRLWRRREKRTTRED
ncbi:MAG: hypothetical protein Q9225_005631 [Loekoesia sp. 1 TL-2023]